MLPMLMMSSNTLRNLRFELILGQDILWRFSKGFQAYLPGYFELATLFGWGLYIMIISGLAGEF